MKGRDWASVALALYVAIVVATLCLVSFNIEERRARNADAIIVDFTEPAPEPKPEPKRQVAEAPRHEKVAAKDNSRQVSGTDATTRTVNRRALFKQPKGGTDGPVNGGNPYAREAEREQTAGTGGGLNPVGNAELDEGLLGRGLVGALPAPRFDGNRGGKVVIRVTVNEKGAVTSAEFEPQGSTTSDAALVSAAKRAAMQARFTESKAFMQGGVITYRFVLK